MPLDKIELWKAVETVAAHSKLKVRITHPIKGALLTGAVTALCGLAGGRMGMVIGGTIGRFASALWAKEELKSVLTVVNELTEKEKAQLFSHIEKALVPLDLNDAIHLVHLLVQGYIQGKGFDLFTESIKTYLTTVKRFELVQQ